jgi:hypothetical protein
MAFIVVMAVVITTTTIIIVVIIIIIIIIMCIYTFIYLHIQWLITQLPGHHKDKKEQANWKANKEKTVNQ